HSLRRTRGKGDLVARSVDGEMRGARERLVETLRAKGIRDLAVLRAFEKTPRHAFIPTGLRHRAYEDSSLPIGNGQTISQPWVHARYLELLQLTGRERVSRSVLDRAIRRCCSRTWWNRSSRSSESRHCCSRREMRCNRRAFATFRFYSATAPSAGE